MNSVDINYIYLSNFELLKLTPSLTFPDPFRPNLSNPLDRQASGPVALPNSGHVKPATFENFKKIFTFFKNYKFYEEH